MVTEPDGLPVPDTEVLLQAVMPPEPEIFQSTPALAVASLGAAAPLVPLTVAVKVIVEP